MPGGTVRGRREAGVAVFRGIPFASLPERFGAPGPVQGWTGVRDASAFGPAPPQAGTVSTGAGSGGGRGGGPGPAGPDPGWLTANVWSPDLDGRRPVMVWIQGGAYVFGTSGLPEYDGSALARDGVVVVTFNYRVGLEGFGLVDGTPANRGLLDQVAALEWVREAVGAFGGDPTRVTVFGQSAGAGCVAALLAMPRAQGLFGRAIAQSVPGTFFTPALAADVTRVCAAELGVAPADLPTVDPDLLPVAVDAVLDQSDRHAARWGRAAHARVPIAPVVDGDVLPATPWAGITGRIPLLVGHTRDEQRLLSLLTGVLGQVTRTQAVETAELFAPDPQAYLDRYPDPERLYEVVRSDWLFRMPSVLLARAQLAAGGAAHVYELTWPAPGMGGVLGACHGLDVPLVFGTLTAGQPAMLIGEPGPEAESLSAQLRRAWVDFATTGHPGWPTFAAGEARVFDAEPRTVDYPERASLEQWTKYPAVLHLA